MKYALIRAYCRELGFGPYAGYRRSIFCFYAWPKRPLSDRGQEEIRQTELVRQAWTESVKIYGNCMLTNCLHGQGELISENRVMRMAALAGIAAQMAKDVGQGDTQQVCHCARIGWSSGSRLPDRIKPG